MCGWRCVIQLNAVRRVCVELGVVLGADDGHVWQVFVLDTVEQRVGCLLVRIKLESLKQIKLN